jgi:hypothetical protein
MPTSCKRSFHLLFDEAMTMSRRISILLIFGIVVGATLWLVPRQLASDDEIDVIVNKANDISELSAADAKKIFMGDKSVWPNGKRVTIVMFNAGSSERVVVLRDIYKMTEADYSKYFLQAAFTGRIQAPPKEVGTAAQIKQFVAGNPGAVSYVKSTDVDDTVKVVLKLQHP